MIKALGTVLLLLAAQNLSAAEPVTLSERTYRPDSGVLMLGLNWGRTWKCGRFENAQIEALTFRRSPLTSDNQVSLELKTPFKIAVEDKFVPYAFVVEPGEYILTGFDVKVARSVSDVGHLKGSEENLVKDGKPMGGRFSVNAGEAVYIGHFGLDCGAEPFLWRHYLESRKEFEGWVAQFREEYPFVRQLPTQVRLFETTSLGNPFALANPTIK